MRLKYVMCLSRSLSSALRTAAMEVSTVPWSGAQSISAVSPSASHVTLAAWPSTCTPSCRTGVCHSAAGLQVRVLGVYELLANRRDDGTEKGGTGAAGCRAYRKRYRQLAVHVVADVDEHVDPRFGSAERAQQHPALNRVAGAGNMQPERGHPLGAEAGLGLVDDDLGVCRDRRRQDRRPRPHHPPGSQPAAGKVAEERHVPQAEEVAVLARPGAEHPCVVPARLKRHQRRRPELRHVEPEYLLVVP